MSIYGWDGWALMIWLCGTLEKMCLLGSHPMLITVDWYQGSFHPVLPSITHPQQTWDSVQLGQWLTPQMAWLWSKPTTIQGEMQKFLHLGRKTSTGYQDRWGVDWQGTVLLEMGSQGDAWLNPSQQCPLSTEQTKHTLTKHTLTGQHVEGLFGSPLLKSGEATFGYSPVLAQKGCGKTGTGPLEGCQSGYPENMTSREGGGSRACQSGTEGSKCGLHAACDCLERVTQIMEPNFPNNAKLRCKRGNGHKMLLQGSDWTLIKNSPGGLQLITQGSSWTPFSRSCQVLKSMVGLLQCW